MCPPRRVARRIRDAVGAPARELCLAERRRALPLALCHALGQSGASLGAARVYCLLHSSARAHACDDDVAAAHLTAMLETLPDDARRLVLQRLSTRSLIRCEAVSRTLRSAVTEDGVWQPRCLEYWPSCHIGSTVRSYRCCFASANGWLHLPTLPRAVFEGFKGTTRRRSAPMTQIHAFDADETRVTTATMRNNCINIRFQSGEIDVAWVTGSSQRVHDLKLLPDADAVLALVFGPAPGDAPFESVCQVVRLNAHALERGTIDAPLPEPIWSNRIDRDFVPEFLFDKLLLSGPSHAYLLNTVDAPFDIGRLDLSTGLMLDTWFAAHLGDAYLLRSACHDGECTPHELTVGVIHGADSELLHHDLRTPHGACALCATGHANLRRVRLGGAGKHTVLTSHSRSKSIKLWDLRKFGSGSSLWAAQGGSAGARAPLREPADEFRCVGNAPDMHCEDGIIAAVSGGAPGTTYGAKLQIFSAEPRRLSIECILPEIVIDDGYRLNCPVGITLKGRTLTLMADRQRLLQCWVPRDTCAPRTQW